MPAEFGYSQLHEKQSICELSGALQKTHSKSRPSSELLSAKSIKAVAKAVRFSGVATEEEKNREPVHPPTESNAETFFDEVSFHLGTR